MYHVSQRQVASSTLFIFSIVSSSTSLFSALVYEFCNFLVNYKYELASSLLSTANLIVSILLSSSIISLLVFFYFLDLTDVIIKLDEAECGVKIGYY